MTNDGFIRNISRTLIDFLSAFPLIADIHQQFFIVGFGLKAEKLLQPADCPLSASLDQTRCNMIGDTLIPKLGNLDPYCPTLCGDDRIVA